MKDVEARVKRNPDDDFPIMREYAEELYELVQRAFSSNVLVEESDHFGFMALCYVHKQIEHARALLLLLDNEMSMDATVVARVMLEGYIYLGWAYNDAQERALSWRSFVLVYDLETLLERKANGEEVDELEEAELRARLQDEAGRFYTRGAEGKDYANPYQRSWTYDKDGNRVVLPQMISEFGDPNLKKLYDELSQLGHWTARGMGPLVKRGTEQVCISFRSNGNKTRACAVLVQALAGMAGIVAAHFSLPFAENLNQLFDAYLRALGLTATLRKQ